jgi:hypothetical protein
MGSGSGPDDGRSDNSGSSGGIAVSAVFDLLWNGLADLLGTAATAALLKRAAKRAASRSPELTGLLIQRRGLVYGYTCPPAWSAASAGSLEALRELAGELRPLLVEMTGQLVIQHLARIDGLRERGLFAPQEEST